MKNKMILIGIATIALVASFLIASKLWQKEQVERLDFLARENAELFVRDYSPTKGAENPQVYVTEFMDPECESCRGIHAFVKQLLSDYEGKMKLIIRYAPFHRNSRFAIRILEAAREQGKYWETLDVLFRHQSEWGDHHHPRPELIWNYLPEVGLDIERVRADMNKPEIEQRIEQDVQDGQRLGVRGTPTFFVNGKPLENFGPQYLREAIERELQEN